VSGRRSEATTAHLETDFYSLRSSQPELEMLLDSFPDNYSDEIRGIWRTIDAEGYGDRLSVGELAAINLMYELTVFCTSILAEDSDGNVYHGRNLDYR